MEKDDENSAAHDEPPHNQRPNDAYTVTGCRDRLAEGRDDHDH